ncbi:MAG: hypothetical protein J6B53_04950 [Clostridia bacterium]|nr:hypothetical protein [Clostridia bacterium]
MSGKKGYSRAANACGEILTYPQVLPDGVFGGTEYGLLMRISRIRRESGFRIIVREKADDLSAPHLTVMACRNWTVCRG